VSRDVSSPEWQHRIVHANGQRFHLVEEGTGPLILLLHGFPECWTTWRHQIVPLAEAGYHVVAPDMRGYGRSSRPKPVDAYRITELVRDVVGLVEALGESTAIIMGHDWGAGVAWTAAWTRPDVFRAVACLSIPFGGRAIIPLPTAPLGEIRPSEMHRIVVGDPSAQFYRDYWMTEGYTEEVEANVGDYLRRIIYGFSADGIPADVVPNFRTTTPQEVLEFTRPTGACIPRGGRSTDRLLPAPEQLPDWLADDIDHLIEVFEYTGFSGPVKYYGALDISWETLAPFEGRPVDVPAIYIGADRDVATLWGAESIALFPETVPQLTETVILSDCGHWMTRERAEETNAALLRFLSHVDAPTPASVA
jgi:pimeloyl-ACP methyl ester carboxylesterase